MFAPVLLIIERTEETITEGRIGIVLFPGPFCGSDGLGSILAGGPDKQAPGFLRLIIKHCRLDLLPQVGKMKILHDANDGAFFLPEPEPLADGIFDTRLPYGRFIQDEVRGIGHRAGEIVPCLHLQFKERDIVLVVRAVIFPFRAFRGSKEESSRAG